MVKEMAQTQSQIDKRMVNQVLDDCVACGKEVGGTVNKFYRAYKAIRNKIGVSLADEADPDKAFPATHKGRVLG